MNKILVSLFLLPLSVQAENTENIYNYVYKWEIAYFNTSGGITSQKVPTNNGLDIPEIGCRVGKTQFLSERIVTRSIICHGGRKSLNCNISNKEVNKCEVKIKQLALFLTMKRYLNKKELYKREYIKEKNDQRYY